VSVADVEVDGRADGLDASIAGLEDVVRACPDYLYRTAQGRIAEVWVTADTVGRLDQLR
jgi:hypothetical protein